jgi:hypothetical protein
MPCEAVVYAFYFLQQLRRKHRHDVEGTAVWVFKAFSITPQLKTRESYCCTAQILFMIAPLWKYFLPLNKNMYTLANITVVYRGPFCWCGNVCVCVFIAIGVGLDPVKSNRSEDPMAVNNNHSGDGQKVITFVTLLTRLTLYV